MNRILTSWGNLAISRPAQRLTPISRSQYLQPTSQKILAVGNMRCYGDEAYNDDGVIINSSALNRFIHFDRREGLLTAECGVTLEQVLKLIVPCGWFLNVTPGTKYITLAGAVANDVHGKNHHKYGSFASCVEEFELYRSNDERLICSRSQNSGYFFATIGGLGLTGWITWIKISLLPIQNSQIISNAYKFANLDEYFSLNAILEKKNTYTVAWIDCLASGGHLGRGIYYTAEHAGYQESILQHKKRNLNIPLTPPFSLINRYSLKAFNYFYYHKKLDESPLIQHYDTFFYPLDSIRNWNRIYGRKGFYQYQFVVPLDIAKTAVKEALELISRHKAGSFLAVLKTFGNNPSGGFLSFPRPGVTIALDFANQGKKTKELFALLDKIVIQAHGAIYPAKDSCMSREAFACGYPDLDKFKQFKDPGFSSNFWRRVGE